MVICMLTFVKTGRGNIRKRKGKGGTKVSRNYSDRYPVPLLTSRNLAEFNLISIYIYNYKSKFKALEIHY